MEDVGVFVEDISGRRNTTKHKWNGGWRKERGYWWHDLYGEGCVERHGDADRGQSKLKGRKGRAGWVCEGVCEGMGRRTREEKKLEETQKGKATGMIWESEGREMGGG